MDLSDTQGVYNLLEEKWIPVLYGNGRTDRVGIWKALTEAGKIRQIAASNPMDRVALLRFLLAVLMWCKEDAKSAMVALDERNTGIPESWLAKLKEFKAAFNLLGDGKRFYQNESIKGEKTRPIGDLLVEFPGADSLNHMRHVVHGSYGLCPACCTMGILRLSVWAPANSFYPASVNPGSAAYAFINGQNLFEIFYANLPETNLRVDQAPWLDDTEPESPGSVDRLAWRPRKLWMNVEDNSGHCAYCGEKGTLIKELYFKGGWPTPVTSGQEFGKNVLIEFQKLNDDYKFKKTDRRKMANNVIKVVSVIRKCRMNELYQNVSYIPQEPKDENDAATIARIFDQLYTEDNQEIIKELTRKPTKGETSLLDLQDKQLKKFWVEDPHLLKENEPIGLPDLSKDVGLHASKFWRDALRLSNAKSVVIGIVGDGQYLFHDTPTVQLSDVSEDTKRRANLSSECRSKLFGLLAEMTQSHRRGHNEMNAALKLLIPSVEAQIRDRLYQFNSAKNDKAIEDKAFLLEIFTPVVEQVLASTTTGSPFRRQEVKRRIKERLNEEINKIVDKAHQTIDSSTMDVSAKPRKGGNEGGPK